MIKKLLGITLIIGCVASVQASERVMNIPRLSTTIEHLQEILTLKMKEYRDLINETEKTLLALSERQRTTSNSNTIRTIQDEKDAVEMMLNTLLLNLQDTKNLYQPVIDQLTQHLIDMGMCSQ